jgi:hypothetical protein
MNNTRMFSESDPEDVSLYRDAFVPLSPVALPAPFGSGRKGKDKSHEEYAAAASTLGWSWSYNSYAIMEALVAADQKKTATILAPGAA